jgi:hypothetical protein
MAVVMVEVAPVLVVEAQVGTLVMVAMLPQITVMVALGLAAEAAVVVKEFIIVQFKVQRVEELVY